MTTTSEDDLQHRRFRPAMNWIDVRIFVIRELGHGSCWALLSMIAYVRWPELAWKVFAMVALATLLYRMATAGARPTIIGLQSFFALVDRSIKNK